MQPEERQFILDNLLSSQDQLLALTRGLTPAQWNFRESPARWSIAENIEHCLLVEQTIARVVRNALAGPAQPEKKPAAQAKDAPLRGMSTPQARARQIAAPEVLLPTSRWRSPQAMLADMQKLRTQSIDFAQNTDAALRDHFAPHHVAGDLDCYQWLIIMALHGARHAAQVEEIKANPAYPV